MGLKESLNLADVPKMTALKPPQLFELRRMLAQTKASEITDDVLLGIGMVVEVKLGPIPKVKSDIINRLNALLTERRSFLFGQGNE